MSQAAHLSPQATERLFARMAATYGAAWTRQIADVPLADAKAAWAHELAGYATRMEPIAWALENLPERCPNVIEFRNLCRQAPATQAPRLPEPKADPARVAAELAKLGHVRSSATPDRRDWARRILASHQDGGRVNATSLRFAKQALHLA